MVRTVNLHNYHKSFVFGLDRLGIQKLAEKTAILKEYYQKQDRYYGINGEGKIEETSIRLKKVIDSL